MSEYVSPHFKRSEFACKCGCGFDTVDAETLSILEDVRQYFMAPVIITSGCRCEKYNYTVGGSDESLHVDARAADFKVVGKEPREVYSYLNEKHPKKLGLGLYSSWVHLDTRTHNVPARWGSE